MAVAVTAEGFVVRILGPPREHPPPHVHVEHGPEEVVVIHLGTEGRPPQVWAVYGMRARDVLRAYRLVEAHHDVILATWRRIHG
ncbi:MAG: DUF4160 domain-containing protein [Gemmatimonadales bacterium]